MTTITRDTDGASITPDLVLDDWVTENETQTVVHHILGRADVDLTLRPALDASGTLRLLFLTHAQAEAARVFHLDAATFTINTTDIRLPLHYVPQGRILKAQQDNAQRWILEVPFQEIRS